MSFHSNISSPNNGNRQFWDNHFVILKLQKFTKKARKVSLTEPGHMEIPYHAADPGGLRCHHMHQGEDCLPSLTGSTGPFPPSYSSASSANQHEAWTDSERNVSAVVLPSEPGHQRLPEGGPRESAPKASLQPLSRWYWWML